MGDHGKSSNSARSTRKSSPLDTALINTSQKTPMSATDIASGDFGARTDPTIFGHCATSLPSPPLPSNVPNSHGLIEWLPTRILALALGLLTQRSIGLATTRPLAAGDLRSGVTQNVMQAGGKITPVALQIHKHPFESMSPQAGLSYRPNAREEVMMMAIGGAFSIGWIMGADSVFANTGPGLKVLAYSMVGLALVKMAAWLPQSIFRRLPMHTARRGLLDTGADINLVAEEALDGTGYENQIQPDKFLIQSFGKMELPVDLAGFVKISWHVNGKPQAVYTENFWVVPRDIECEFDFLLGRKWIEETDALQRNNKVIVIHQS